MIDFYLFPSLFSKEVFDLFLWQLVVNMHSINAVFLLGDTVFNCLVSNLNQFQLSKYQTLMVSNLFVHFIVLVCFSFSNFPISELLTSSYGQ